MKEYRNKIIQGDTFEVLKEMPDNTFDTIITSPPYWGLRDYGVEGQIGLEKTLDEFIEKLLAISNQLQRVLKPTGVMFWNHGDCYGGNMGFAGEIKSDAPMNKRWHPKKPLQRANTKQKCLMLQNYRLILKMIDEQGWILRNTIIWHKSNAMPSSVKDRFSNSYEPVYMLVKKKKYWFDLDVVRVPNSDVSKKRAEYENRRVKEGKGASSIGYKSDKYGMPARFVKLNSMGKNPGDVWKIPTHPFPQAHFATFPEKLIIPMIKSSCPKEICEKCGKARVRITKNLNTGKHKGIGATSGQYNKRQEEGKRKKGDNTVRYSGVTTGWTKCDCQPQEYEAGIVLDPFMGSGTVGVVAKKLGRNYCGIELNKDYIKIANQRIRGQVRPML